MKRSIGKAARVADVLFTATTLLVAALLIIQCAGIYFAGTSRENISPEGVYIRDVYSPEIVSRSFSEIMWAVILWLALFVVACVFFAIRRKEATNSFVMPPENMLALLKARKTSTPEMIAETRARKIAGAVCAVICLICAAMAGTYLLNIANFNSRDLEFIMGAMLLNVAPYVLVAFIALSALAQIRYKSVLREIEEAKRAPKRTSEPPKAESNSFVLPARLALYVAAVALVIVGIMNGGMYDVLVKAINICTECIGLG